ncbi:MAG: ATP-dependent helicase HrpB [Porticoccaceae bacterium]|nr:ATP-dependent helicase HrpB [Porticoccaceae bacterium]
MPNPPLPIETVLPHLGQALSDHNRCLLVAEPGAGKTTRAPLYLLATTAATSGRWLLLEPRRVAARLAAAYMAEQLGEAVGETVGYRVRGESKVSASTRIDVVTQGILTRMLQSDPLLEGVAGIIFDEFHERSLEADLGLALALDVQQGLREDLKLLVMSATLDVEALLRALGKETPVINCPGRSWPVTTYYRPPPAGLRAAREPAENHRVKVIVEALANHSGHLLVFLPGVGEIRRLHRALEAAVGDTVDIHPLHGQLNLRQQQQVLRPPPDGRRRIILSTAIAESSLTVPGVTIVIDAGLERLPVFQPRSGLTKLDTRSVNSASADQRRGRAGREAPGYCYRLWSQEQLLTPHREAEILQADLSALAFELVRWGVADANQLHWVTPPPQAALTAGRQLLNTLGITADGTVLTDMGKACARWPTQPRLAVLLESARVCQQLPLACWLVAWLEESPGGDDIDLATLFSRLPSKTSHGNDRRWYQAAQQWASRASCALEITTCTDMAALLARAFPDRIAQHQGNGRFKLVTGGQGQLPENHPLARQPYIVAVELDGQASGARIFYAAALSGDTLEACFPKTKDWHDHIAWDNAAGRLSGEQIRKLGTLIVERRPLKQLPPEAISAALVDAIRVRGSFNWSQEDRQLLGRLRLLHAVLGAPWPDVSDKNLLETLETWLQPHINGITRLDQLERLPLASYVLSSLDWSLQQQLNQLAPSHILVPSGARLPLDYSGEEPVLAVKLQEMFGQTTTPTLVNGRIPVLIHLLSPARRPVQVTRDLANFWKTTYFDVRKDLKGRYPRHPWPDNPLEAQATAKTKKATR